LSDSLFESGATVERQVRILTQLGELLNIANWNYRGFNLHPRPTTGFRWDKTNPTIFLRAVVIARDIALDTRLSDDLRGRAIQALSRIAPPAAIAVAAKVIPATPDDAHLSVQAAVAYANLVVDTTLRGPTSPYDERTFADYKAGTQGRWIRWSQDHPRLMFLWFEPDLRTLRANMYEFVLMFGDPVG
jgi:hypothetical protein